MKNLEHLESRLRSWKPRRPSPALKSRIFTSPAIAEAAAESFLPPWRWWAPVTALTIAALTLLTGQFSLIHVENRTSAGILATAALSQPDLVAYLPAAGHSEANAWPGTSFEWTNQGSRYTNGIIP